jgi:YD repeat-containing protein
VRAEQLARGGVFYIATGHNAAGELLEVEDQTGTAVVTYTYDANHNRTSETTSAGTTTYAYDAADTELVSATDPSGKVTTYTYDTNGNLTSAVYDPSGANQTTSYTYDANGRLQQVTEPSGETVAYTYDSAGNRLSKTVTTGGSSTEVKDVYQGGRVAYQTDGANTLLATFAYDDSGVPTSVQVGSDPTTAPRYYYVYDTHGNVVALVDANGNAVSNYSYDAFGAVQTDTDNFGNGWRNPYLYDGKDDVRYNTETGRHPR